jgi:hypothetical protein
LRFVIVIQVLEERFKFGLIFAGEDGEFAAETVGAAVLRGIDLPWSVVGPVLFWELA